MDIFLDDELRTLQGSHDFVISFDIPDNLGVSYVADVAYLNIQAKLKLQEKSMLRNRKPILINLRGSISDQEGYSGTRGGELISATNLPYCFVEPHLEIMTSLTFKFSQGYIVYLEEKRAQSGSKSDLLLYPYLEGLLLVRAAIPPRTSDEDEMVAQLRAIQFELSNTYYSQVKTSNTDRPIMRIARSYWQDRFLEGLGYKVASTIQIPGIEAAGIPAELLPALEHLTVAKHHFLHEEYRAAVNRCRQSLDALLGTGSQRKNWVKDNLTSILGSIKADMIDQGLLALNKIHASASHSDNAIPDVEIDRETAEYVIATLSLIFSYIYRKLR